MKVEISDRDFDCLLMALGMASGAVMDNRAMFYRMLELANAVNKNNTAWSRYEVPPAEHQDDDNEELVRYFFEQMQKHYQAWLERSKT